MKFNFRKITFLTVLRWPNTVLLRALANAIQRAHKYCMKTNMASIQQSFYLLNVRAICTIFLSKWTQCIDGFTLLLQRYVRKGNDANSTAILSFCLLLKQPS